MLFDNGNLKLSCESEYGLLIDVTFVSFLLAATIYLVAILILLILF